MHRGFKGKRRKNDPTYKPYDSSFHPNDLIDLMANGLFDCQIEDVWYISHATFHRWRQEHPELQEAYEVGESKRKAYKIKKYLTPMIEGKLEGKHSFNAIKYVMDAELEYTKPINSGTTTQININSMNISQMSMPQLIQQLESNMKFLENKNVLPAEFKVLDNAKDSESNEHNQK